MLKFIEKEPEIRTTATNNTAKRSLAAENLVNKRDCARKYDISLLKIIPNCSSVFDLLR